MTFRYKRYGPAIVRPVVPINLVYGGRAVTYEVLVDSGADGCIFDAQIGGLLGIDVLSGRPQSLGGITGVEETAYVHPVTIRMGYRSFPTEASFLPNIARLGYGVVGQDGFFEHFLVSFDRGRETIRITARTRQR